MRYPPEKAQPYLFHQMVQIAKAMLLLAALQMLARFFFIGMFTELVALKRNLGETFQALFLGFRYDLIPAAYLAAPPFLLACSGFALPREGWLHFIARFNRWWFAAGFLLLFAIAFGDLAFYSHFQEHINVLFFGVWEDDTAALLTSIRKNYRLGLWLPLMALGCGLVVWLLGRMFKRQRIDLYYAHPMAREELGVVSVAGIVVLAFLARGNFTRLPLSIEDAHISEVEAINELSVNGVIALNRAMRVRRDFGTKDAHHLRVQGYQDIGQALEDLHAFRGETGMATEPGLPALKRKTPPNPVAAATRPHVVVFVMESFGSYWWPYEKQLPFLDSFRVHTEQDHLFLNFLSAENGTIGSVVALASNLPLRPGARFLSEGEYMRTPLASGAHLPYKRAGYTTRFLYGGKLGWRQLGSYLQGQNWDVLEGADQLKEKFGPEEFGPGKDTGNEWGLYDEYLFRHVANELRDAKTPQFFLVLTTSNHPPYETPGTFKPEGLSRIPPELVPLFSKSPADALMRFRTLQYANRQLGDFLTALKTGPQKDGVVVAATGDHSFWVGKDEGAAGIARKFGVPFYLYLPQALRPATWDPQRWGSHTDIMPTLYHRTLSEAEYWAFGLDMFGAKGAALNSHGLVVSADGAVLSGRPYCWDEKGERWLKACETDPAKELLRNYQRAMIGLTDEFLRANAAGAIAP